VRGKPDVALARVRVRGDRRICACPHQVAEPVLDPRLAEAGDPNDAGPDHGAPGEPSSDQVGHDVVRHHALHLARDAGGEDQRLVPVFDDDARRAPARVRDHLRAPRQQGLLLLLRAQRAVAPAKKLLDVGPRRLVALERKSQRRGNCAHGQVVVGGAESPRGDHQVNAPERLREHLLDACDVVADG